MWSIFTPALIHCRSCQSRSLQPSKLRRILNHGGGRAVTFLRWHCGGSVTPKGGVPPHFFLLPVENPVASLLTFGYAKETCLSGLFPLRVGASSPPQPLDIDSELRG